MSNEKDGGPAFPAFDRSDKDGYPIPSERGMTLRDYFAAKIMASVVAHPTEHQMVKDHASAAGFAYEAADAMLSERRKQASSPLPCCSSNADDSTKHDSNCR